MKIFKLIILFALLITGCVITPTDPPTWPSSWTKTYAGAERPQNETVELFHDYTHYMEVLVIDGIAYTKTPVDPKLYYNLLPGMHEIKYKLRWRKRGFVAGLMSIDLKAGHRYTLSHVLEYTWFGEGPLTVMLKDNTADEFLYSRTYSKPVLYEPSDMDLQMEEQGN